MRIHINTNKDLDLRRYGVHQYTKAEDSNSGEDEQSDSPIFDSISITGELSNELVSGNCPAYIYCPTANFDILEPHLKDDYYEFTSEEWESLGLSLKDIFSEEDAQLIVDMVDYIRSYTESGYIWTNDLCGNLIYGEGGTSDISIVGNYNLLNSAVLPHLVKITFPGTDRPASLGYGLKVYWSSADEIVTKDTKLILYGSGELD